MEGKKKKIFLVGVDHKIQYNNANDGPKWRGDVRKFEDYLVSHCQNHAVDLLAEEFSEEAVHINNATGCTVRDAARRLNRPHIFCDPDTPQRKERGITKHDHNRREMFWLERLNGTTGQRVLFICGDDHVDSFSHKLQAAGFEAQVLSRGWGKDWRSKD